MLTLITFATIILQVRSGLIAHGEDGYGKATSYQSIHIEHFKPVPTHAKEEYKHESEHQIPIGKSSSHLEVHHGDKHDHGYAVLDSHSNFHVDDEHHVEDSPHHEALQQQYAYYTPKSLDHESSDYQSHNSLADYSPQEEQHSYDQNDEVKLFFPAHEQENNKEEVQTHYQVYYQKGEGDYSGDETVDEHHQEHQEHKRR